MDPLTAATATAQGFPWGLLVGLAVVAGLVYAASCTWWPFTACLRCKGSGRRSRADGKVWRLCRRCKGSGRRLRTGRRVWNYFHGKRDAAQ